MVSHHQRRRADKHRRVIGFTPTATFADQGPSATDTPDANTPSDTARPTPPGVTTPSTTPPSTPTATPSLPPPPPPSTTTPIAQPTDTDTTTQPSPTDVVVIPTVASDTSIDPITTTSLPTTTSGLSTVQTTVSQTLRSIAPSESSGVSEPKTDSTSNVGGIIGGAAGGLLGLVVIIFIIKYLLRRRSRQNEDGGFNSTDFRRSAVLMNDPPTHEDTVSAGFNPRPPTMIERRLASPAPTFGTQYGAPGPHYFDGHNGQDYGTTDQYGQYQSFAPGQMMNNMSPPQSATSANPLYPNAPYAQSPFSPIGPPVDEGGYDDRAEAAPYLTRQPSSGTQLNRQPSYGQEGTPPQYANYPGQAQQAAPGYPGADYVDLDRSSVSPYQAAQYAEISKKLNTEVPAGLNTPAINEFVQTNNLPAMPARAEVSPFADPSTPITAQAPLGRHSSDTARDLHFPVPPSPAHTTSSRSRVDSSPPMLPEITVESRVSVTSYDFPNSVRGSAVPHSPMGSGYPSGATAAGNGLFAQGAHAQYPTTPSPLASSFAIDSPPAGSSFQTAAPASPRVSTAPKPEKRPETVYDAEDAYGGI